MSNIIWLEVENPTGKRAPKAGRVAGITSDNKLYVWAGLAGNEGATVMCAGYDGIGFEVLDKHAYFPEEWMLQEYPQLKPLIDKIREKLVQYKAEHPGVN